MAYCGLFEGYIWVNSLGQDNVSLGQSYGSMRKMVLQQSEQTVTVDCSIEIARDIISTFSRRH